MKRKQKPNPFKRLLNKDVMNFLLESRPDLSEKFWDKADLITVLSWALPRYAEQVADNRPIEKALYEALKKSKELYHLGSEANSNIGNQWDMERSYKRSVEAAEIIENQIDKALRLAEGREDAE